MNKIQKLKLVKTTENGDKSYNSTGNNLVDLVFLTEYFENHVDEVTIGNSEKEKLLAMYIRDPRNGMGRKKLGRRLMQLAEVENKHIVLAGRYDDLLENPTDENLVYLKEMLFAGNELAKKWMPRLKGKDKLIAKELCKMWNITEKEYRKLIKADTTEYKLSYVERETVSPLAEAFNKKMYIHPLVDTIDFEKVPSLAMTKYCKTFSKREDIKPRFDKYIQDLKENKAKVNTSTTNVYDTYKTATRGAWINEENTNVIASKMLEKQQEGIELDCLVIHDSSGSMHDGNDSIGKANSIALALATKSTYCPNELISFSSRPHFIKIKGNTLNEKYKSFQTRDIANTDFSKVMELCTTLNKYPEYFICLSDMEFNSGSYQTKEEAMKIIKVKSPKTKIIWWNLNSRNKTVPEFDEYGNIFLSGYSIQMLKLLENKFNMDEYIEKILLDYKNKIGI